jgi:Flp pilus assembly protein CpaB
MKRRNWLWFVFAAILALAAGAVAMFFLARFIQTMMQQQQVEATPQPPGSVVVASRSIAPGTELRGDMLRVDNFETVPDGAFTNAEELIGATVARTLAEGEPILEDDVEPPIEEMTREEIYEYLEDDLAVAVPADDILSAWGTVLPGAHVDLLFTLDVILETPMYPEETIVLQEGETIQDVERDQSMDDVSVLVLQDLEVLRIIEEPQAEEAAAQQQQQQQQQQQEGEEALSPVRQALLLRVGPQDAVILKYLLDSEGIIDVALRDPENNTLFDVEPVNINYLMLRYGIELPEPLE